MKKEAIAKEDTSLLSELLRRPPISLIDVDGRPAAPQVKARRQGAPLYSVCEMRIRTVAVASQT